MHPHPQIMFFLLVFYEFSPKICISKNNFTAKYTFLRAYFEPKQNSEKNIVRWIIDLWFEHKYWNCGLGWLS